jgi:hypothetical protein
VIDSTATVNLDYRKIRSAEQLIRWAEETFALPAGNGESVERFADRLYHHIGKGTIGYTIVEHNTGARTPALEIVIAAPGTGWKTALVSGLAHDYGLHLTFTQAPQQGHRGWWPW